MQYSVQLFFLLLFCSVFVKAQDEIAIPIRPTELSAQAEQEPLPPLFEYGIFVGSVSIADYPASDQSRIRTIPAPLIRYHGDLFRADDEGGTRFRFINSNNFHLDLSFGGSFPTDTNNNQARLGMPNLDFTLEVGPRLLYYFYRNKNVGQVRIGIPYRASVATNFTKWYGVGAVFAPVFQIDKYNVFIENLDLYFSHSLNYLDEGQADYFFQIDPVYQTADRATYDAKSGFLSSSTSLAVKYQWKNKMLLLASSYTDYSQSANTKSYLHRNNINWSYFVGFGWIIGESEERGVK